MLTNKKLDELERGAMVALELPSQSADVQAAVLLGLITALREAREDSDENANAADRAYKRAEKAEAEVARLREENEKLRREFRSAKNTIAADYEAMVSRRRR